MKHFEEVFVEDQQALRDWLAANHGRTESVWLVSWKKGYGPEELSYDQIVDALLCFGWVDSLPRKRADEKKMLLISPRNPKSNWSQVNKAKVERLTAAGEMQDPGQQAVAIAKSNGAWDFLTDVDQLLLPADLQAALRQDPQAWQYFDRFPPVSKRGILEWIKNAKQVATRQQRIAETIAKAAQNRKANHPPGRDAGPAWRDATP